MSGYDGVSEWNCSECGHVHTGARFGWICVGCPCEFIPDHPDVNPPGWINAAKLDEF